MIKALVRDEEVIGAINLPKHEVGFIMWQNKGIMTAAKIVPPHKLNQEQKAIFESLKGAL